jgi:hypothetical protein
VSQVVKKPDWTHGSGPWPLTEREAIIAAYAARRSMNNRTSGDPLGSGDAGGDNDLGEARKALNPKSVEGSKILVNLERAMMIRHQRGVAEGQYLKATDVEAQQVRKVHAIRSVLQEVPKRAHFLVGKSKDEIELQLREWMKEACDRFVRSK